MVAPYPGGFTAPGARAMPQQAGGLRYRPQPAWQNLAAGGLQGLGQYLMALGAGQPQQAPMAFSQGLQGFQEQQDRARQMAREDEMFQFRKDEAADTKAERERKLRKEEASAANYGKLTGLLTDADPSNDPTGIKDLLPYLDPETGYALAAEFLEAEVPTVKDFYEGGQVVQKQYNTETGQWEEVGRGGESWEPYTDPKSGKTGQKNIRTGKIDWDPGQSGSVMAQVGTDAQGNPIYDFVGTGGKPMSDSGSQQTLRATLIDQALKDIEGIDFGKVSATKAAVGSWMSQNPVGEAVAGGLVLNDDEKKLLGAQGKIQEAVISAITGAAYTEEQKNNMRAAMVPLPTDGPGRRLEKLKAAAQFMRQLDKNSGYNRLQGDANNDGVVDTLPPGFQ